jgi:PAS domain S-box-containing protein
MLHEDIRGEASTLKAIAHRRPTRHRPIGRTGARWAANDNLASALKAQAARFNTALEHISQGLCCFDRNRRLVMSNRRYAEIYGLLPEQIRPGMTLKEILALREAAGAVADMTPDDYIAWTQARPNALTPNGAIVHLRNGHVVSVRHQPIPDGGYVSTHEDVTERFATEAALRHGEKLRAIGQMTGGIAHDVNNLLTVIGGNIEDALVSSGDCGGARPQLEAAMQSISSAAALLRRMVCFSRAQPPVLEPTDLNAWLRPLRDMTARMLGPRYRLLLRPDPALPELPVDRPQLESAVLNLILNARDAMPDGGAITIETARVPTAENDEDASPTGPGAGGYVAITVRDSGPGMQPDVAARAFEPFFSTKPAGRGSGLGLSMVQQFALHAGGAVSLRSAPGAGTAVRIVLPSGCPRGHRDPHRGGGSAHRLAGS